MNMDETRILIKDNKFDIVRYEGFGYSHTICNYDKDIFNLKTNYESSGIEGRDCKTIYSFEINKLNPETKFASNVMIEFIDTNGKNECCTYYIYNSNTNYIKKIDGNNSVRRCNKCVIL